MHIEQLSPLDLLEEGFPDYMRGKAGQNRIGAMRTEAFQTLRAAVMPSAIWDTFSIAARAPGCVKLAGKCELSHDPSITTIDGCDEIIAGICTAGEKIDELISECQKTSMSKAVMLDQVSTWVVQQIMVKLLESIKRTIPEKSARFTPVIRPGFEKWPISNQAVLFSMLDGSRIGVRLTRSLLMVPSKSITFIIGIAKGEMK